MSSQKLKLFKIFDDSSNFLSNELIDIDTSKTNELLFAISSPGLSYHGIFDLSIRNFVRVSNSVIELFGEQAASFTLDKLLDRIHPDDMNHFLGCNRLSAYFLFKHIDKKSIPEYKVCFQFRMKNRNEEYKLILHQVVPLVLDTNMNLASVLLSQSDISHITNVNNRKVSFINLKGNQSYFNIGSISDLSFRSKFDVHSISIREKEILTYISKGFSTTEIAEVLTISPTTVRTHRNNILKKTGFKTIPQVVGHFVRNGII
jgi:DNA-binding CsgD family transcriptional regulator